MASQSQSRLNRLLTLLDAGSTQATRFAAGRQIGEIAKFYPQELNYLLKRVSQYLHNKKWETRVAAAHAIGAVAENVKHASLSRLYSHMEAKMQQFGISVPIDEVVAYPNLHRDLFSWTLFRSFDIVKVLDFGVLLASGGQEYDVASDNTKDPKEQLAIQKYNLQRRLGLDVCEHFMDLNDMISDEDILSYKTNSHVNGLKSTVHSKNVQQLVARSFPRFTSKMPSVRELNLLKRRAKVSSKDQGKSWSEDEREMLHNKTAAMPENFGSSISSKMFVDSASGQNPELALSQKWPFQNFVEQLLLDVFSPVWEVRHGSAMALREILTFQGSSAGVFLPDLDVGGILSVVQKKSPDTVNGQNEFVFNVRDTSESFEPELKRQKLAHSELVKTSDLASCEQPYIGIPTDGAEDCPDAGKVADEFDGHSLKVEYEKSPSIVGCTVEESHDDSKCFLLKGAGNQGASGQDKLVGPGNITKVLQENDELHDLVDMARRCWLRNCDVLQDSAIRLLCVLVLDRFGDYVSDQVVAPVRETCAQALGAVLKHVHSGLVVEVLNILLQMQRRPEWEIRHGSLLGIRYLVAVRQEMIPDTIGYVLPACKAGLEDPDDDVRAVAADALVPAASTIVSLQDDKLRCIVMLLWDILLDLDDLSPSTSSVMNLLAEIYSQEDLPPTALCTSAANGINLNEALVGDLYVERSKLPENPFSLVMLAPRLWPFMRHSIRSVRYSAIRTLERLLEALYKRNKPGICLSSLWPTCILGDTLRIVFQNLLLESSKDILQCSLTVWRLLLQCPANDLSDAACSLFSSWMDLAATPYGSPFDAMKMFWPVCLPRKSHSRAAKVRAVKLDRELAGGGILETRIETRQEEQNGDAPNVSKIVVGTDTEKSITHTRDVTANALGVLASRFPEESLQFVITPILKSLTSLSGVQRQVACIVLISWFKERKGGSFIMKPSTDVDFFGDIKNLLLNLLACMDPSFPSMGTTLPYTELSRTYAKMRLEASQLLQACESSGMFRNLLSRIKVDVENLTVDDAISFTSRITKENSDAVGEESPSNSAFANLDSSKQHLLTTASYLKCVQGNLHITVTSLIAAAVVWMLGLPTKLNPIILPLMASIKREQEEVSQLAAAEALAELICLCVVRKPSPNDKLIKNIFGLTCLDPGETPQAGNLSSIDFMEDQDLFSFVNNADDQKSRVLSGAQDRSKIEGFISRRGSELVLKYLCEKLGSSLFQNVPKIWDCLTEVLIPTSSESLTPADEERILVSIESLRDPQTLINNIQMARCIAPMVNDTLKEKLVTLLPCIILCLQHSDLAVRLAAARCIASIAKSMAPSVMIIIIQKVIPMLRNSTSDCARQGAGMVVSLLVHGLGGELVPYALLLVVPLLRCMSDCSHSVRKSVTYSFASLVPLLPLARGISLPSGVSDDFLKNAEDARFLEQLLDNSSIDDYKLQTDLKVTLRRYQQEGISWLAFLRRFKLHGILCDDMGLGKTLQASAILATDIVEHRIVKNNEDPPLSLIVCPSTLVGHWAYEIEKYIDGSVINAFQYVGSAQERLRARNYFHNHNVVITSYDVVRKDINYLGKILWNYCVLDEGHIIKNSRSKVTHAVKQLRAHNRLILSGTPIQNNILDLWSLFDFLMPGFLGSERQFQATYGKPLLAARDAKCSARDAEGGVLAMEALHKQVMPFLLRRTKEDVLSDLPEKIIQDRYCDLSPVQLKLYEQFSGSHARKEISTMVKKNELSVTEDPSYGRKASSHVFQALQYLLKLCSHPLLVVDPNILDSVQDILSELLPTCSDVLCELHELHHAPKLVALREILEECGIGVESLSPETTTYVGQHRVLIFAQHKTFLDIIERDLFHTHMKSVSYLRLDGSVEPGKRFEIVKTFNSDPTIDILLLTTHVGGLGLNLTSADTLIFMEHDWNPMRDLQAMDRAHRLGQRKVVNVHRLIMRGTLEEKVMNLQKFKLSVANSIVNADNASLKTMNTDQLLDLFTPAKAGKPQQQGENAHHGGAECSDVGAKGLKAILSGLENLWDQSQYTEEYDLNQFLAKLNA